MEKSEYLEEKKSVGGKLAGGKSDRGRVENDFYATDPISVKILLDTYDFIKDGDVILEPCVGNGHIVDVLNEYFPSSEFICCDLVDRQCKYPTIFTDFLAIDTENFKKENKPVDIVITNPPYAFAQEFVEHSLDIVKENGKVAMFLKIQFLEGMKRQEFFKKNPLKYVYVFVSRQSPWRNGSPIDEKGKRWSSTMCFAWFIWEKGFQGEPIIRWLS